MIEKNVFNKFNKQKIKYAVLRNYEDFKKNKDIDILIDKQDAPKTMKILKDAGLVKRGFILNKRFDIKIGCIHYNGRCVDSGKEVLKRRKRYHGFYILSKEDEARHLILKSIFRGEFKEKYKKQISYLLKKANYFSLEASFIKTFGKEGKEVLEFIKRKDYEKALKKKENLYSKINKLENRLKYFLYRIRFTYIKR